jgi:hypothetical protein
MKPIYVNHIIEQNGITHGIAALDKTVLEDIDLIYTGKMLQVVKQLISTVTAEPFYFFDRFCQFVIYLQYQPVLGLSLKVSDYHNDVNAALDEYNILSANQWQKKDRDKILQLFQEIQKSNEVAEMIIKDPVS